MTPGVLMCAISESLFLDLDQHAPGTHEAVGIDRLVGNAGLVMQMRPGGAPRRSRTAKVITRIDDLPALHRDRGEMRITRGHAIAVVDLDEIPVSAGTPRSHNAPGSGSADRCTARCAEIDPGMQGGPPCEGVAAHTEIAADTEFRPGRARERQLLGGTPKALALGQVFL